MEVASQQSFSAAGKRLGMTGAAVSKQVRNLELELGVKLLNRTTRHVSLTEEGALYFEGADRALADLFETEQRLQELKARPAGKLKINAPMSFGTAFLTELIARYALDYPEVKLEVDFDDRWVDVVGEGYDLVVRIGVLQDSGLQARQLADCPICLCVAPECLAREGELLSVEQLKTYPAVTYSRHGQAEYWRYGSVNTSAVGKDAVNGSVKLNSVFSGNTAEMQLQACLAGLGVALLPAFAAHPYLQRGDLLRVLPHLETRPVRGIYAVFAPERAESTRVRLFLDALIKASNAFAW